MQTVGNVEQSFATVLVQPDCLDQLGSAGGAAEEALLRGSQGWTAQLWKFATRVRMCLCDNGGLLEQFQGTKHVVADFGMLDLRGHQQSAKLMSGSPTSDFADLQPMLLGADQFLLQWHVE